MRGPSGSAAPFVASAICSVLAVWTLVVTSVQFAHRNCGLRTLPRLLLGCVVSARVSGRAMQPRLSVSASAVGEMALRSGLSAFLVWAAAFPPVRLAVFVYLNWWGVLGFALPGLTSWMDSADFPCVSDGRVFSPICFSGHLQNSSVGVVLSSWGVVRPCGGWDLPSGLGWPHRVLALLTYLLLRLFLVVS